MFASPASRLRSEVLELRGFGQKPSTLFCSMQAAKPSLMLDAYTRRAPVRHLVQEHASYSHVQEFLHRKLPPDPGLFNEYHAFVVETGKRWCRPAAPECEGCPLEEFLPAREMHESRSGR